VTPSRVVTPEKNVGEFTKNSGQTRSGRTGKKGAG